MRRALASITSIVASVACFGELSFAPASDSFLVEGSPASEPGWLHVRVEGRADTCIDLPSGSMREWRYGSLDYFFPRRRRSISFYLRPLAIYDGPVAAISLSFIWLDSSVDPFTASDLAQLGQTLTSADQTQALLMQRTFDPAAKRPPGFHYELEDLGAIEISGRLARRIEWRGVGVRKTPSSNEFYLLSLSPTEALIIELEFDRRTTFEERNVVLPKVLRSIAISDPSCMDSKTPQLERR